MSDREARVERLEDGSIRIDYGPVWLTCDDEEAEQLRAGLERVLGGSALKGLVDHLAARYPGKWWIETDWAVEVHSDLGVVAKFQRREDAETVIAQRDALAEEWDARCPCDTCGKDMGGWPYHCLDCDDGDPFE